MRLPPENPDLLSFLQKLFDTNEEFSASIDSQLFASFQDVQTPYLTILKCSDSRVQMESFDKTPQNGVFAVRNIGNQLATSEGSVDFGVEVLNTPFLLIIGHSDCGAVNAVIDNTVINSKTINKELKTLKITCSHINEAVIENINYQVEKAISKYHARIENGSLAVIGAVYDFKNVYGHGYGKVVLTNINGIKDANKIKNTYLKNISNLHFLEQIT
jgi:carbonic anhydrase